MTQSGTNTPDSGARIGTYFLGRYRVVDEIGIGGMASVHLGRMDGPGGFQKWVAIKRIHPHLIEDDSFVQMFLDEARVAARISHPNVATVFELGKHDDSYWIAMEYLHGEPLRELMRRTEEISQTMPPEIACRIIADAAEGLHAAHELTGKNGERLNLVHRDVTPHNLFVTYDGTTKVVDFGIAKFSSRMSSTRAGTLKGKLAYMSPEQVHGEQIDRRTDIFALGVVLWELTTGQRLFRMESDLDTLAKVQECNVPRPSTLVRGYPIDLEKIVMRALSKNRGERFKTAREFSRALQGLLMRRGLFIASDEVAAYVQSIFVDRIQKRDAHLRWAAEVTQTINIDKPSLGLTAPSESSLRSVDSNGRNSARPAAGIRPTMQGMGPPSAAPDTSRQSPTVRPPGRSDPGFDEHARPYAANSGSFPTSNEEEFDDNDATIITIAKDLPGPGGGKLAESGETAAMQQQIIHRGGNPFAATMDARALAMHTSQEFHPVPASNGLGPNLMGAQAPNLHDSLPLNPLPLHQIQNPYQSQSMPGVPNASVSQPRILLAPLEFGSPDNRTITARSLRRGTPLWAVAVGSALVAIFLLAALYLVVTHLSPGPATSKTVAGGASGATPQTTGQASASSDVASTGGVGGGPFAGARSAFSHAIEPVAAPVPTTMTTPPATPFSTANTTTDATTATATATPPAPIPARATTPAAHVGPQRVIAPPADAMGLLTVVCTPACDQVIDNGKLLGPAPIFRLKVPIGEHHLQFKNGRVTKVSNAIVTAGDLRSLTIPM